MSEPSLKTRKVVYERWRGKCAFCGVDLPFEQHHIVAKNDPPELIDDPDNLILLCANHHGLTLKKKPDERPAITIEDIADLQKSGFAKAEKKVSIFPFLKIFWFL